MNTVWMRLIFLFMMLAGGSAARAETDVDLELVLAVDVSWSMDIDEQRLQRQGYIDAFRHPDVISAIASGLHGRIAVTYVEWAGESMQHTLIPWTQIDGPAAAEAFAKSLEQDMPLRMRRTSISEALVYTGGLFATNDFKGLRRVIDVSGDGPNNQGRPVEIARDALVSDGVVINGLPVMLKRNNPGGFYQIQNLDAYYQDCVIGGEAAFVVPVQDKHKFTETIRRKLVLEIAGSARSPIKPAQFSRAAPRADCLVGEKMWRRMQGDTLDAR